VKNLVTAINPLFYLFSVILLAGCQSTPQLSEDVEWSQREADLLSLQQWQFQGRVNARYENESHTPRIRWIQHDAEYTIRLWGTLNAGSTLIQGQPGLVEFEQGGESRTATTPEQLIVEYLGYELPVSQLIYWIRGVPTPNAARRLELGEFNEVISLQQAGWSISYQDYVVVDSVSLPQRVEMTREQNNIRLVFVGLNWSLAPPPI